MEKPINADNFMRFFEETIGVKFVDVDTGKSAIDVLAEKKSKKKSDYDLWLEKQDEETKEVHKMGEF